MNRLTLLLLAVAAVSVCGCQPRIQRANDPALPNVLLISLDTLRADHVSAYGYSRVTTPDLDRFAAGATLFENAYSHSPKTALSHMTLMTASSRRPMG